MLIAAGLGCRRGCECADLLDALAAALAVTGHELSQVRALCAPDFKGDEPGYREASNRVGKPLLLFTAEALAAQAPFVLTHSSRVLERFGLPSIAETAALAGAVALNFGTASGDARLLGPRRVSGGASCALACGPSGGS